MELKAFHSDKAIKAEFLARVKAHAAADEIIHGRYWENGKGCAVGCTIHGSNHADYERVLGIPQSIARLEDCIFEGLQNGESKKFPAQFLSVITPGADLSLVTPKFLLALQKRNLARMKRSDNRDKNCEKAIEGVIAVILNWSKTGNVNESAAWSAAWSARSAAWSARSAAESAAESAAWSAKSAAESAAESAAWSARSAAWSAAESAAWSARSAEYSWMAKTLLKLLKEAK